jgi:hypothetical protein
MGEKDMIKEIETYGKTRQKAVDRRINKRGLSYQIKKELKKGCCRRI